MIEFERQELGLILATHHLNACLVRHFWLHDEVKKHFFWVVASARFISLCVHHVTVWRVKRGLPSGGVSTPWLRFLSTRFLFSSLIFQSVDLLSQNNPSLNFSNPFISTGETNDNVWTSYLESANLIYSLSSLSSKFNMSFANLQKVWFKWKEQLFLHHLSFFSWQSLF